jgi:hypothetical protein
LIDIFCIPDYKLPEDVAFPGNIMCNNQLGRRQFSKPYENVINRQGSSYVPNIECDEILHPLRKCLVSLQARPGLVCKINIVIAISDKNWESISSGTNVLTVLPDRHESALLLHRAFLQGPEILELVFIMQI